MVSAHVMHTNQGVSYLNHTVEIVGKEAHQIGEWVSDCCLTPTQQFYLLSHGENKLIFNEMTMRYTLY
jgi:hypothetical protein